MNPSIEQRLDILESREQIKELRAMYAWHAARGEAQSIANLFTEDGVFECLAGGGKRIRSQGRDAIARFVAAGNSSPVFVLPMIHNHIIVIEGGHAQGTCAMENPGTTHAPNGFTGYYLEKLRRENGRWFFTERLYYLYTPIFEQP